jgi:hypothetical protein
MGNANSVDVANVIAKIKEQQSTPYNVPAGNWTPYIKSAINGQETNDFIIGQSKGSGTWDPDPAFGCAKQFTSTYQCGNGPTKTLNIAAEAGGQTALYDCSAENKICKGFRLTLGDDGNLVLTDSNQKTVWTSNTNSTGLALDEFKATNSKYGRNYLLAGETLKIGEFIGSPSGNCYLIMVGSSAECTQSGLQLKYNALNCTMTTPTYGVGQDDQTNGLYSVKATNINNLGKVGYVDENKVLHEYPAEMLGYDTTYTFMDNYDSLGNEISSLTNTTATNCQQSCNATSSCSGYVYNKSEKSCSLKNSQMFPSPQGLRVPNPNMEMYIRNKTVNNNLSCAKTVETGYTSQWELYPTGDKMSMETLCELGAFTAEEHKELTRKNKELNTVAATMQTKLDQLLTEDQHITQTFDGNVKKINKDMRQYKKVHKKIKHNQQNLENVTAMMQDTELNNNSSNLHYLLWTSFAVLTLLASIRVLRNNNNPQ